MTLALTHPRPAQNREGASASDRASDRAGDWAIDLTRVEKVYKGKVHALRGIDMKVRRGEIFGLLGPNGAGKSTLVKILMTVIRPTRAEGWVLGRPIGHKPTLAKVGYLPEHHKFPEYLTGAQVVDFYAALAGVPRAQRRRTTPELLDLVGMNDWADHKVRGYSKGMRQRVGIAQSLACDPDLVVLDEPTDGVDPVGRRDIREMLARIKEQGKTVFLNSHLLSELEMVCDRVAILVQGNVASQGTINELTVHRQFYEIELAPSEPAGLVHARAIVTAIAPSLSRDLSLIPTAESGETTAGMNQGVKPADREGFGGVLSTGEAVEIGHAMVRVMTGDAAKVQPLLDLVRSRGYVVKSLRAVRPSLEDLFMEAVTDRATGKSAAPGAMMGATGRPAGHPKQP